MARRYRYSVSDDHKGYKVPITDFVGIYPSHRRKDGTLVWRAQVFMDIGGVEKLKAIGYYTDELEAAKEYDKFVRENNVTATLNFDELGKRNKLGTHLSAEQEQVILSLVGTLTTNQISKIIKVPSQYINKFIKTNGIKTRGVKKGIPVFIDRRGAYEEGVKGYM